MHEEHDTSPENIKRISAMFQKLKLPEYQEAIRALCSTDRNGHWSVGLIDFQVLDGNPDIQVQFGDPIDYDMGGGLDYSPELLATQAVNAELSEREIQTMVERVEDAVSQLKK